MKRQRLVTIIGLAVLAGLLLYVGLARVRGAVGFPLDDAWIHQTYARNLAEYGQWAFVPGRPSAGSTAPLWTLLVALGYVLGIPFRAWTYALGGLCLAGTALLATRLAQNLFPDHPSAPLLTGLACAFEWHLVWAAASGMETLLFALLALAIWVRVTANPTRGPLLTGILGGALVLTRPEGILVVGLAALGILLAEGVEGQWRRGLTSSVLLTLGTGIVVTPYLALNLHLSGTIWPNTYYAKQTEYAVHRLQPLLVRLFGRWGSEKSPGVVTAPLVGGQILFVPGILRELWRAFRRSRQGLSARRLVWWLPVTWVAATLVVYTLRLPVTYQHGRYLIPIIPPLLVYGVGGTVHLVRSMRHRAAERVLARTLLAASAILFPIFWVLGAQAYATDVAVIEGEMVAVARWLEAETEPTALIAAHDIGAIGYFSRRPLLDMAGLVSPEVIPFIRDEEALLEWLRERGARYLVTFPSWYPTITADPHLEKTFQTRTEVTVDQGGENMAIYALRWERVQ
ncbi:MAG: hypothetical protein PVH62_07770 [Anaerolineae bacterium]|jgi:hypothetical protein